VLLVQWRFEGKSLAFAEPGEGSRPISMAVAIPILPNSALHPINHRHHIEHWPMEWWLIAELTEMEIVEDYRGIISFGVYYAAVDECGA
jgi:hypothetical protein